MASHPRNKRRKDSKNEPSPEEMQLLSDSHSLRQRIIEDSRRLISMQKEMKKMKQKRRKNNNQEAGIVESKSTVIPAGTTLYYIIFGLAGKVVTGSSGIIFVEELINGLIGSPPGRDDVKSDALRASRQYTVESYGATQCWVPTTTALVGRTILSQLKTSQTIVKKMKDLFDGGSVACRGRHCQYWHIITSTTMEAQTRQL